jgi:hypothetical protein
VGLFIYRTGKLPKVTDARTLQLDRYLAAALPEPAAAVDYHSKIDPAWLMLGNDCVGDCALAGMGHADMLWAAYAEERRLRVTTSMVIAAYSAVTGYVPGDPSTDRGTALIAALRWWRKRGIDAQRVRAFVEVDPRDADNVRRAIDWFGCAYVGVELPDAVLPSSRTIPDWTCAPDPKRSNTQPNPHNGHCVIYAGYDQDGLVAVTWGQTVRVSWAFHAAYCDELYALLAPSWEQSAWLRTINPAFDAKMLAADLAAIAA